MTTNARPVIDHSRTPQRLRLSRHRPNIRGKSPCSLEASMTPGFKDFVKTSYRLGSFIFRSICLLSVPHANDRAARHLFGIRRDRKSTRLNSSHVKISYAVFCLKKKTHDHK